MKKLLLYPAAIILFILSGIGKVIVISLEEYYANYFHFRPETEGKTWWRTRQAVVEHIQKNILPEPPPVDPVVSLPSPLENLKEKFNSFFK